MLWIREEEVFTKFDYSSVEQRCRELDLHGLWGVMGAEKSLRLLRLFFITILPGRAALNG